MRAHPTRGLVSLLVLVPLLAACGGGDGEDDPTLDVPPVPSGIVTATPTVSEVPDFTSGGNAPDPCSLLTVADISAAVGATVGQGEKKAEDGPLGGESCIWTSSTVPVRTFQVDLKDGGDITVDLTPEQLFDQSLTTLEGLTPASGIGEKAAFGAATGLVFKDGIYMLTSVGLGNSETARTALRTLTEKAAASL